MPSSWVALLLSLMITYSIIRVKYGKELAHLLGDSIFYFIIVWKLSVVVTDFKVVMQYPLSLLYFNGGKTGVYLGILAVLIQLLFAWKKGRIKEADSFGVIVGSIVVLSMYQVWIAVFNTGPFTIRLVTVLVFFIFIMVLILLLKSFEKMPQQLLFLTSGLHLFISALQPAGIGQTTTIVTVILTIILSMSIKRKNKYMEAKQ